MVKGAAAGVTYLRRNRKCSRRPKCLAPSGTSVGHKANTSGRRRSGIYIHGHGVRRWCSRLEKRVRPPYDGSRVRRGARHITHPPPIEDRLPLRAPARTGQRVHAPLRGRPRFLARPLQRPTVARLLQGPPARVDTLPVDFCSREHSAQLAWQATDRSPRPSVNLKGSGLTLGRTRRQAQINSGREATVNSRRIRTFTSACSVSKSEFVFHFSHFVGTALYDFVIRILHKERIVILMYDILA